MREKVTHNRVVVFPQHSVSNIGQFQPVLAQIDEPRLSMKPRGVDDHAVHVKDINRTSVHDYYGSDAATMAPDCRGTRVCLRGGGRFSLVAPCDSGQKVAGG